MQVLYVEDGAVNRRVLKEMLRALGMEMLEAEDGAAGLAMIEANDFDLVLMDLHMPGMDGLTAISHLRARSDAKAQLPIVVVTADDCPAVAAECRTAGADDVLHKPVSLRALQAAVRPWLSLGTSPGRAVA